MSFKFNLNAIKKAPAPSKSEAKQLRQQYYEDVKKQNNSDFIPVIPFPGHKLQLKKSATDTKTWLSDQDIKNFVNQTSEPRKEDQQRNTYIS